MSFELALVRAELSAFVKDISAGDLLPKHLKGKPADVLITMVMGAELGFTPMASLRLIHVIEGKPTLDASAMAALVMASPACRYLRCTRSDDNAAEYETLRVGHPEPMRMSYTIQQAHQANLTGKANWKSHPAAMLRARCTSTISRAAYPDVVHGIYTRDELEDEGAVIEGSYIDVSDQAPAVEPAKSAKERLARKKPTATLDQLTEALIDFGASASRFREWLAGQPEFEGKTVPPVSEWDAERLGWAVAALRNGLGERFRAFIRAQDGAADDGDDDAQVPE